MILFIAVALAGAALSFAVIPLVGWSSAIAMPIAYIDWFRSAGSVGLGSFVWEFFVVGLLGAGIAVSLATVVTLFAARSHRAATVCLFLLGFFVGVHLLHHLYFGQTEFIGASLFGRGWLGYGIELSVIFGAAMAALIHKALSRKGEGL